LLSIIFLFFRFPKHVQLWLLSGSALVWVGDRSCTFGALSLAMQTQMDAAPAVSNLLGRGGPSSGSGDDSQSGGEGDEAGAGMAARIAKVMRMPVFVSLNIGPALTAGQGLEGMAAAAGPELHAVVERAVLKELKTCQKLGMLTPSPAPQ